jgi:hypothetical protein
MLAPLLITRLLTFTYSHQHIDMQYDVTPSAHINISIINMATQNNHSLLAGPNTAATACCGGPARAFIPNQTAR